ncbi:MAG TPA: hypothetical protein VFG56_01525 [Candidatus Saccharimonadales bacterium]|nr:hypothetical protein [Candidatus Saccharimonadales bacterium]
MNNGDRRIAKEQDVNYEGRPIHRPPELISEPVKGYWTYIWIVVIVVVILAWAFLFGYFSNHQAPYAAPLR